MKLADKAVRFSPLNQPLGACNHVMPALSDSLEWSDLLVSLRGSLSLLSD